MTRTRWQGWTIKWRHWFDGHHFSDWFVWDGHRHCFICWQQSGFTKTLLENGEVRVIK